MFQSLRLDPKGSPSAVVVGVFQDERLDKSSAALDAGGVISEALKRPESTGECNRIVEAFPTSGPAKNKRVIVVGLGKRSAFLPGNLRGAAAAVARRLVVTKDTRVDIEMAGALGTSKGSDAQTAGRCFGEGLGLIAWNDTRFRGTGCGDLPVRTKLAVSSSHSGFRAGLEYGLQLGESANLARTLSQTPPNVATPRWMADQARAMARKAGLSFRVFEGRDLVREKFEGLINVGKASENKPCMVRLEYRPAKASKSAKPVVLIGKTMTYDTGGLSLKVNNGMVGMKRDKDGGCAVIGAMHAIGTYVRPGVPVVALLAIAENSVSDEAYRPDDVITYRNGVTVEVTNTDAEGRLVLADALCWACEQENPRSIIDLATLTGGVVTALGSTYCGMFCEDDALRARIERASASSGERVWRLPMHAEYRDMMKSPIADILNSNPNRKAHPIQGAAFLSYFVKEGIPWCHLDIAGVHAVESDCGPFIKGPTGWGARLLADLLAD